MTLARWPIELQQCLNIDEFTTTHSDERLITPPETGPSRVRRRYSACSFPVSGYMNLFRDRLMRLDEFWTDDLGGGVLPFMFHNRILDSVPLWTESELLLLTEDSVPLLIDAWWLARFAVPYETAIVGGGRFRVTLQFEILP